MSATLTRKSGFDQESFDAFLAARKNEPAWLTAQRRSAWQRFLDMPMPNRTEEEWMRTDIRLFKWDNYTLPQATAGATGEASELPALLAQGVDLAGHIATVDSRVTRTDLDPALAKQGVIFGSLDELASKHSDLVQKHLFQTISPDVDRFAALHAAAWSGGALLYVPKGVKLDRPLHHFSQLAAGGIDTSHLLVILEEGAEATLLSETASLTESNALHCGGIELVVNAGAKLRYVNLQNWGHSVWHFAHQKAVVGRGAQLQWTIGALGAKLAKVNQHVALAGRDAHAQVNGVMFTEGKQHLTYNTLQHHEAENCKSDLLYKGALQDKSRLVWRGMIKVDVGAQKTDGYQRNDNLMLSADSRADSIPGLEIEADDVRCTHGATAGRVDEEQIFYCQSRGLTRKEAIRTVVTGFFQQVFDRITIDSVREALGEAIRRRVRDF